MAVQRVIEEENLLPKVVQNGELMYKLLCQGLLAEGSITKPFTFDIRGRGAWWGIEFDFSGPEAALLDFKGKRFAMLAQARCRQNGLMVMGMDGGPRLDGSTGGHLVLGPAYNATPEEIEKIVEILVKSVDELLKELLV